MTNLTEFYFIFYNCWGLRRGKITCVRRCYCKNKVITTNFRFNYFYSKVGLIDGDGDMLLENELVYKSSNGGCKGGLCGRKYVQLCGPHNISPPL